MVVPYDAVGLNAVFDCGISRSHFRTCFRLISTIRPKINEIYRRDFKVKIPKQLLHSTYGTVGLMDRQNCLIDKQKD